MCPNDHSDSRKYLVVTLILRWRAFALQVYYTSSYSLWVNSINFANFGPLRPPWRSRARGHSPFQPEHVSRPRAASWLERHADLAASELSRLIEKKTGWPSNSPDLKPLDYRVWDTTLEKYHELQPKPETTDELNVALHTICDELPQEQINKAVANFKRLTAWSWLSVVITSSICSKFVHLQICILVSSPTNRLCS